MPPVVLVAGACVVAMGVPAVSAAATSPPSVTSAFVPNSIGVAGTSALSITITNPNSSGTLSGVSLTDALPSGLVVESPNGESGSCGSSSVITANPGTGTISLSGGSIKGGANCTFSVDITSNTAGSYSNSTGAVTSSNGGSGNSDTESLTVLAPPTIALRAPGNNVTYDFGQRVITSFSCQEAANGPGVTDCSGSVDDSDTELANGTALPTSVAGPHTFAVTAISGDGQVVTDTVNYTVRPDDHFTVSHVKTKRNGSVRFQIKLPGAGRVVVRELASRVTFGQKTVTAGAAGIETVTVPPSRRGAALVASKHSRLVIRLRVTFTPRGGVARTVTIGGVDVA